MITISLRFEEEMKKELDDMCDEMGMNLTTFFMIYAKKVLRDRRIPFDIVAPAFQEEEILEAIEDESPPGKTKRQGMTVKKKTVNSGKKS